MKTSRRRPVSVDTNIDAAPATDGGMKVSGGCPPHRVESGGTGRGGTGGGFSYSNLHSGSETSSSHRYSNRNSQPFTERELEQTFQQADLANGKSDCSSLHVQFYSWNCAYR